MTEEEALGHLREFLWALQRYRSITMEQLGLGTGELHLSEKLAAEMWPWVFGEKCPLPILAKIIDDAERGSLIPADYFNMMVILHRFIPEVKAASTIWRGTHTIPEGPPETSILGGWEGGNKRPD